MNQSKVTNLLISLTTFMIYSQAWSGGIPLTSDDLDLNAAINSQDVILDVLSNDASGIANDTFKEVIAVCDSSSADVDCVSTSYSDGIATITINGSGDENNLLLNADNNASHQINFKYIMQNSANATGSAQVQVMLDYVLINNLSDSGNGTCNASACTLRDAITFANNDNEPSTLLFERELKGTITLNSGLTITSNDLTITGPGADKLSISGNLNHRVIHVPGGTERFSLSDLTLINGKTLNTNNGAGMLIEGSLDTQIDGVRFTNNDSANDGGGLAISNSSVTIKNSEFSENLANQHGAGISITGGFGYDVTIENITISHNDALDTGTGLYVNTTSGHNLNIRFVTSAFNLDSTPDNYIEGNGNVFIESSVFDPGLAIPNSNNITTNSVIANLLSGNVFGDNTLTNVTTGLDTDLVEINQSGLYGHTFEQSSVIYNHVDNLVGNSGCGTEVSADQFGQARPNSGFCDAGAYEYHFIDVIFATSFE
jgi:hypothetical protein